MADPTPFPKYPINDWVSPSVKGVKMDGNGGSPGEILQEVLDLAHGWSDRGNLPLRGRLKQTKRQCDAKNRNTLRRGNMMQAGVASLNFRLRTNE